MEHIISDPGDEMNPIIGRQLSAPNLPFEVAEYPYNLDKQNNWMLFRVGTCEGLWCSTPTSYDILAITNNNPGNGHFNEALKWFEKSCIRDNKALRILEVWNTDLKKHLLKKRMFSNDGLDNVIKNFGSIPV